MRHLALPLLFVVTLASGAQAATTCPIHADDPVLNAALVQPVPTVNVIPDTWADVGDAYISFQGHFSQPAVRAFDDSGAAIYLSPRMRHSHLEIPSAIPYCEISGPFRFPFRAVLFQTDGFYSANIGGENVVKVEWDDPTVATNQRFAGDPSDMGVVFKTGHLTIDPRPHPTKWWNAYAAPPHGWYEEMWWFDARYAEGITQHNQIFVPFYSMVDPTQPVTVPYDPRYLRVTDPWRGLQVFSTPDGCPATGCEHFWGTNSVRFEGTRMLPTFGTLAVPYAPRPVASSSYGGAAFEAGGMTSDWRIGENLHMGILGTFIAQHTLTTCCGDFLTVPFDGRLGLGHVKPTFNWNQTGGPVLPNFPTRRTVSALLTVGINNATTTLLASPPPPPPPPPPPTTCDHCTP